LLEIALKVYVRVIQRCIRERVHIHSTQFGFMPGRGTIDPIFILRQVHVNLFYRIVQEKILEGNRKRYRTFVDLKKAFDRVPREVLYWSLRRKGISEKLVRVIRSMYDGAVTTVRSGRGKTLAFEIKVGVHHGSCLSPLLFIIVMNAVSEYVRHDVPWDKTETMVCARTAETLQITDKTGKALKQVENLRYLGSVIHAQVRRTSKPELLQHGKNGKSYEECCVTEECPLVLKEKYTKQW